MYLDWFKFYTFPVQKLRQKALQEAQPKLAEINKQLAEMGYAEHFFNGNIIRFIIK